jgi:uncharacterized protein
MKGRGGGGAPLVLGLLVGSCVLLGILLSIVPRPTGPVVISARAPTETAGSSVADTPAAGVPTEPAAPPEASAPSPVPVPQEAAPGEGPPATDAVAVSKAVRTTSRTRAVAGRVAVIIDDAGYSLSELAPFLSLEGRISIAVIPGLPHSAEAARRVRAAGKDLLLHSPMQPEGGEDAGPRALLVGMSEDTIRAELGRSVEEIGPVEGINNHMGSLATADDATMLAVLRFVRDRGLVFVDSKTTARSVVERVAAVVGARVAARDVFLDNDAAPEQVRARLDELRRLARARGQAIAIGHVQTPGLAELLRTELPRLSRDGFVLVAAQDLAQKAQGGVDR